MIDKQEAQLAEASEKVDLGEKEVKKQAEIANSYNNSYNNQMK